MTALWALCGVVDAKKTGDCDWYTAIVFLTQAHMTTDERRLKGPNQFLHGAEPNYGSLSKTPRSDARMGILFTPVLSA